MRTRAREGKLSKILKPSKTKIIILIVAIIAVTVGVAKVQLGKKVATNSGEANLDQVTRGNVEVSITGSAAIEPYERYEIISMVSGDIVSSPFGVGDTVTEGDILYKFDTSSTDISMAKQKLSLRQSEISYNNALKKKEDLIVTAPCNGVISGLDVKVGDDLGSGMQLASINNSKVMKVVLPFNESQISQIWIGQTAHITSSSNMGSVSGKVIDKASMATPQSDGSKLYDVTIQFTNPGAITQGQSVGGEVGGMISPGFGTVEYSETGTVKSDAEGTVAKIYYGNGDYVTRGTAILAMTSDIVSDSIENSSISYQNAQLSLQEQEDKLDDYSITSPINGTVITRTAKAGDRIDKTNSTTVLMVVADISKLKFNLEIDELDISKVREGQVVTITCDALPNEKYHGVISQASVEGVATNGVTTYTAEVVIDEPGNLRPSMNVDASVIVESAIDVLRVPTSDLKTAMGRSFVFVKDEEANNKKSGDKKTGDKKDSAMDQSGASETGISKSDAENRSESELGNRSENKNRNRGTTRGENQDGSWGGGSDTNQDTNQGSVRGGDQDINWNENQNQGGTQSEKQRESRSDTDVQHSSALSEQYAVGERKGLKEMMPQAPEGFRTVEVTIGVSGEDFTEIISGLSEGDLIYSQTISVSSNNFMGMMGGGMQGGGMNGGMGGNMSGGGMNGSMGGGGQRSGNASGRSMR